MISGQDARSRFLRISSCVACCLYSVTSLSISSRSARLRFSIAASFALTAASTKRSLIFSFAGVRERVAPARTALRAWSDQMPPSILAPSSSIAGSARQSFRRGAPARAQAQRLCSREVRSILDLVFFNRAVMVSNSRSAFSRRSWRWSHWAFPSFVNGPTKVTSLVRKLRWRSSG
jgi:hypothetical protein